MAGCSGGIHPDLLEKTKKHPCYSAEAHKQYARIHLPVAPKCNIQCNYCNRKFDCVNESRPGVTSEVLTPELAKEKFQWVKSVIEDLTVVGIAGPGDALADWVHTKATIEQIKAGNPDIIFCLSTNGLLLPEYAPEIVELGIDHVTVTINALDPVIGAQIYKHVLYQGTHYEGVAAAELLWKNQEAGVRYLTERGVLVKVNIVMIKGINDGHIPDVVKKVKELGVFVTNIMPLIPAPGSAFAHFPQTSMQEVNQLRNACQLDIQQMRHCQQCRADAIGRIHEDRSQEFRMCHRPAASAIPQAPAQKQYRIAVTSKHGKLVDQHFGHATAFLIYQGNGQEFQEAGTRNVDQFCTGMEECDSDQDKRERIIDALQDCDAVLTMRIGYHAKERLRQKGIEPIEYCDTVEDGLRYVVTKLSESGAQAG
ncbi:nitrogenase cofactor biosynthesis protein NifB [Heliophilum fasciatum]|uniref:FeMo cofactor biosynthesis protein NifB n=1 Tax=Heliophilum fasciatum TaxID=35700 RepID=A0A4R2RPJ3_9FIRM|nr:nitrogenase cofactor biosynthesis protein NifB [Heliophilum fasciatum]MCW2277687.1 nitrogen fixation protein NifB [Heliophilum fasciatum]TCP65034.1 nitrogen fixation protein NifB [Heliophilum fasciatum]